MGAFMGALGSALSDDTRCFPAIVTLAVTASGLTLFGIGSAFWGLAAGLITLGLDFLALALRKRA
jgi:benzoate membrane transport protein